METGKVLTLYMTMPDMMRAGHRMKCENFECDPNGIINDVNYEQDEKNLLLLVSQKSYQKIYDADFYVDEGVLLENIYVDTDISTLKKSDHVEIGDTIFEVIKPCEAYAYLYALAPEIPEVIEGDRGVFLKPVEHGSVNVGDSIKLLAKD